MNNSQKIVWLVAEKDPTTEKYAEVLRKAFCQNLVVLSLTPSQVPSIIESFHIHHLPAWVLTDDANKQELDRQEGKIDFKRLIMSIQYH